MAEQEQASEEAQDTAQDEFVTALANKLNIEYSTLQDALDSIWSDQGSKRTYDTFA